MKATVFVKFSLLLCFLLLNRSFVVVAQESVKDKKAAEELLVKNIVDSQNFIFVPRFVTPLRGTRRDLNASYYSLNIKTDTLISYLPYFGRAYVAPLSPTDIMFDFTSTKFDYSKIIRKKGGWDISISLNDQRDAQKIFLTVFSNGSASLSVNTNNRDPISFEGYIKPQQKK